MKDEKFILTSLDDENSKAIAEVLGNKTCKKIIDYLGDRKDASEQDIANDLGIPINTIEYNLKKLLKSGLVKKTKNFFWSVKGRKISMYKLANKHIVISPGRGRPNLDILKTLLPVLGIIAFVAILVSIFMIPNKNVLQNQTFNNEINKFSSQEELNGFIESNLNLRQTSSSGFWNNIGGLFKGEADIAITENTLGSVASQKIEDSGTNDYSTTNIQVEGVDEADIVKNDGKYIYVVSNGKVKILNAYPAEDMNILSEINESAEQIFINDDKLIILKSDYSLVNNDIDEGISLYSEQMIVKDVVCYNGRCGGYGVQTTIVSIYDISDRENPLLENKFEAEGNYIDSRMIGDYVYAISSKYIYQDNLQPPIYTINGIQEKTLAEDVYYWDYYDNSYVFTGIIAINLESGDFSKEVFLTGSSNTIFVSQNNIYLIGQKSFNHKVYVEDMIKEVYMPLFKIMDKEDEFEDIIDSGDSDYEILGKLKRIIIDYSNDLIGESKSKFDKELIDRLNNYEIKSQKEREKTIIHKINIDKDKIIYKGFGDVNGRVLNQFSMDEYNGYFRIATTTGNWGETSLNHIYILNEKLEIVGKVEDLAKGERIFSSRFMGERCYLVTFESIDPLFVIDLSDVENPKVLGYLKISGFSDYLHPYDENHIIGIGKDVNASIDSDKIHSSHAIYYTAIQGVKVSLFDVSDVENPIEVDNWIVGERGSESEASYNHKSVLFDKEKGILVLPVSVAELIPSKWNPDYKDSQIVWEGVYILDINLEGINERGRISHNKEFVSEYGPAKDELIGAERKDGSGNIWTKQEDGMWKIEQNNLYGEWIIENGRGYSTGNIGFNGTSWGDMLIDEQPGGINYNRYNRFPWENKIKRSLYMDDVLYTISEANIKANDLNDLIEINSIDLGYESNNIYPEIMDYR